MKGRGQGAVKREESEYLRNHAPNAGCPHSKTLRVKEKRGFLAKVPQLVRAGGRTRSQVSPVPALRECQSRFLKC